jgi:hypothetical protein
MKRPSHAALPAPMHGTGRLTRLPKSGKPGVASQDFIAFADNRFILDLLDLVPEKNVITLLGPETPALFAAPQTADTSS